jgi:hypothetical protein
VKIEAHHPCIVRAPGNATCSARGYHVYTRYAAAPAALQMQMAKVHDTIAICASAPAQRVGLGALLHGGTAWVKGARDRVTRDSPCTVGMPSHGWNSPSHVWDSPRTFGIRLALLATPRTFGLASHWRWYKHLTSTWSLWVLTIVATTLARLAAFD